MPRATQPERQSTGLDIIESMECSTGLTQNIVQAVCGRGSPTKTCYYLGLARGNNGAKRNAAWLRHVA